MKNLLIVNGRLAWPAVIAFVFLCASVVIFDLCWRVVTVSFEALVVGAVLFVVVGLGLIVVAARLIGTREQGQ